MCSNGTYGESCAVSKSQNKGMNEWHHLTEFSPVFKGRARHVSEYVASVDKMFVFGGKNDCFYFA